MCVCVCVCLGLVLLRVRWMSVKRITTVSLLYPHTVSKSYIHKTHFHAIHPFCVLCSRTQTGFQMMKEFNNDLGQPFLNVFEIDLAITIQSSVKLLVYLNIFQVFT